jgi:hypothetical protein
MRDSFVFYRSYYEAIELLPKSQRADAYRAIFEFMFNGNDITEELKDTAKAIFLMAKPTLESNIKKYEAGKKGAEAKKKQKEETKQTNNKPENEKEKTKEQNKSDLESKTIATLQANDKQPNKQNESNYNVNENVNEEFNNKGRSKFFEAYFLQISKLTKELPSFRAEYEAVLMELASKYSFEVVKQTLLAALEDSFWVSKLLEPRSLKRNFAKMKLELVDRAKKNSNLSELERAVRMFEMTNKENK